MSSLMVREEIPTAALRATLVAIAPFLASTVVYGLAFGAMARTAELSFWTAAGMSGLVFSGGAQFVALQLWSAGPPLLPLLVAVAAINARYILLGASLRPWLAPLGRWRSLAALLVLADGTWAAALRERRAGRPGLPLLLIGGPALYLGWLGATMLGFLLGQGLEEPRRYALDFLLAAFCAAIAMALWRGRRDLLPFAAAALAASLCSWLGLGAWSLLAGALLGSALAAARP